jgi:hypothetical protein
MRRRKKKSRKRALVRKKTFAICSRNSKFEKFVVGTDGGEEKEEEQQQQEKQERQEEEGKMNKFNLPLRNIQKERRAKRSEKRRLRSAPPSLKVSVKTGPRSVSGKKKRKLEKKWRKVCIPIFLLVFLPSP